MTQTSAVGTDLPAEFVELARRAGDVLLRVDSDGRIAWSSSAEIAAGTPVVALVDPTDETTLDGVLAGTVAVPTPVRLADPAGTRASIVAVRRESDWLVQLRSPGSDEASPTPAGRILDAAQALDELAWLLSATPRTGREIAVAEVELDRFPDIAALHGAQTAADVLEVLGARITGALRAGDLVAHLTDDRLLVVLRGVHHLRGSIRVANKVRAVVEDPIRIPGGAIVQTASVGVTLVSLGESVDAVLERADAAVAMAVAVGGNVVRSNPPI